MIYLIDTNILAYARNGMPQVLGKLDEVWRVAEVVTSILVVGELHYGAERSARRVENLAAVEKQIAMLDSVLPVTKEVVARFAAIKASVVRKGRVKGDVDLYIAATAIEAGAIVVTNDDDLLDGEIPGLTSENWVSRF